MKEIARLVGIPTIICLISGVLLAYVEDITREPIAKAKQADQVNAMKAVLPDFDNDPAALTARIEMDGKTWQFHVATREGQPVGVAFRSVSSQGYGGDIAIMVGVTMQDTVQAIAILEHKETPGLGANISTDAFKANYAGKPIDRTDWRVKKDGGEIDQITAATISSRAVSEAVAAGLEVYQARKAEILAVAAPEESN